MADQLPVFVQVQRPDGSSDRVRVGTATRGADGFVLSLGELTIGATPDPVRRAAPAQAGFSGGGSGGGGEVFPPYGRSKGLPISGATMQDLEFYANGSRRSLGDPSKSRFHEKERALLAVIEAEIVRQGGTPGGSGGGGGGGGGGGSSSRGSSGPPHDGEGPPPHDDNDIPF